MKKTCPSLLSLLAAVVLGLSLAGCCGDGKCIKDPPCKPCEKPPSCNTTPPCGCPK